MLKNKTALVTGASRGIGRAIALELANAGAQVLVHYGENAAAATEVVARIRSQGGSAHALQADLARADGAHVLAAGVQALGIRVLDVLVANAAVSTLKPLAEQTVEDFDRVFAVNVRAPYFLVQQLHSLMPPGSSIVFLSSGVARIAVPQVSVYSATKGAVNVLVHNFALELGAKGIRVNAVAPGAIDTDMTPFLADPGIRQATIDSQALKRIGTTAEIAKAVLFCASESASWVTGHVLDASGGTRL